MLFASCLLASLAALAHSCIFGYAEECAHTLFLLFFSRPQQQVLRTQGRKSVRYVPVKFISSADLLSASCLLASLAAFAHSFKFGCAEECAHTLFLYLFSRPQQQVLRTQGRKSVRYVPVKFISSADLLSASFRQWFGWRWSSFRRRAVPR